jgi:hypothetical protein
MTETTISRICDAVTARWSEESWQVAREDAFDGQDQDAITAAAEQIGVDYAECVAGIKAVYAELTRRALARKE